MANDIDLLTLLPYIHPGELSYQDWIGVGMALKEAGYSCSDWDEWSRNDSRYHPGECQRKWDSFNGCATPVTGGTIVQMAKDRGWRPAFSDGPGYELGWDSIIGSRDGVLVDTGWLEGKEVHEPENWNPVEDLTTYLETLFEASESVGYVTESWERDGKYLPSRGHCDRSAGELIELLHKYGSVEEVFGDYNRDVGAWIRFNPLDGKGVKNENVTEYRYALVESDSMELEKQHAMILELELPVACLVYSGGKSIHAIVKIDAANYDEYRKRVDYLYGVLKKNGMQVDIQNKNPSRLSRMPGVIRGGHKQFLMGTNLGKASFREWQEWIESVTDELPNPESLEDVWDSLPELAPPLIEGVLRQGHKMLIAGPSKAGKSYGLIELCCAIAEGREWLGWKCTQGKVLYVNLELDRASCLHRFKDIYTAMGWKASNIRNLDIWNLRGKSVPMDKLAPKLIRRASKKNYIAIIIDPIYKIITGDENSADQMAQFCNQFDLVCTELGCAVIYCHHHSKGAQGGKRSMDRASGSGVFARDPDALIDLIELDVTDAVRKAETDQETVKLCARYLDRNAIRWMQELGFIYHSEVCIWKNPVTAMQRTKALGLLHKQIKKDSCMSRQGIPDYVVTFRKPGENPERVTHTDESYPVSHWQKVASPIWEEYASPTWWDINQSDTLNRTAARDEKDERHICPLQLPVIERCVELWSNPGDIVLDPFDGIGSTGYQSLLMGRRHIGIELKESYFNLAVENCRKAEKQAAQDNTEQPSLFDLLEAAT